jgi:hypothetical protein
MINGSYIWWRIVCVGPSFCECGSSVSASPERAQRSVSALSGAAVLSSKALIVSAIVGFIEIPHGCYFPTQG